MPSRQSLLLELVLTLPSLLCYPSHYPCYSSSLYPSHHPCHYFCSCVGSSQYWEFLLQWLPGYYYLKSGAVLLVTFPQLFS